MGVMPRPSVHTCGPESLGAAFASIGAALSGTINWPTFNVALFVPFALSRPILAKRMIVATGSVASGSIDAGIYTMDGARIVSSGSAAQAAAGLIQFLDITDTYLAPGRYYMAVSCSSNTARIRRVNHSIIRCQALGVLQASTAHILPATVTFTTPTTAQIPVMGIETMGVV